jgi:hypothetical protein
MIPMNYFSISAVARLLGCHRTALPQHIAAGNIPGPRHRVPGRHHPVYTEAEVEALRRWWDGRVPTRESRFSQDDIESMRAEVRAGVPQAVVAGRWGVSVNHLWRLVTGRQRAGVRGGPARVDEPKSALVSPSCLGDDDGLIIG